MALNKSYFPKFDQHHCACVSRVWGLLVFCFFFFFSVCLFSFVLRMCWVCILTPGGSTQHLTASFFQPVLLRGPWIKHSCMHVCVKSIDHHVVCLLSCKEIFSAHRKHHRHTHFWSLLALGYIIGTHRLQLPLYQVIFWKFILSYSTCMFLVYKHKETYDMEVDLRYLNAFAYSDIGKRLKAYVDY